MAPAGPRDRNAGDAGTKLPGGQPPHAGAPASPRRPDDVCRKAVHQPKDKSAKAFYGDKRIAAELLATHVLGTVVPDEIAARIDLGGLSKAQTEYVDLEFRKVRHADLVWRAPLRDSALVYDDLLARDPEVRKRGKLPPVLPIVVYAGEEPWRGPTCLDSLLADEAQAFLPFALGHEFVLVPEAEEAQALTAVDTLRTAALRLRYTRDRAEFGEALAKVRELLPESGPASRALAAWVRSSLIDDGAKEADVKNVQELSDIEPVVHTFWGAERVAERRKGREEGRAEGREEGRAEGYREQQATLVRLARRKFGSETADGLASLLEGVADSERVAEVADLIIDCASGRDFLAQAGRGGQPGTGAAADGGDL